MAQDRSIFRFDVNDMKCRETLKRIEDSMEPEMFVKVMHDALITTGRSVKTFVGQAVPKRYMIGRNKAEKSVGKYYMTGAKDGKDLGLIVPLQAKKLLIARDVTASGGSTLTTRINPKTGKKKRRAKPTRIRAKIMRNGGKSVLPEILKNQEAENPFIIRAKKKSKKIAFAQKTYNHKRKVRVVALASPQMALNEARADLEKLIDEKLGSEADRQAERYMDKNFK